jgi:hypothetical protein
MITVGRWSGARRAQLFDVRIRGGQLRFPAESGPACTARWWGSGSARLLPHPNEVEPLPPPPTPTPGRPPRPPTRRRFRAARPERTDPRAAGTAEHACSRRLRGPHATARRLGRGVPRAARRRSGLIGARGRAALIRTQAWVWTWRCSGRSRCSAGVGISSVVHGPGGARRRGARELPRPLASRAGRRRTPVRGATERGALGDDGA